ncbi:MAG: hypothetical protein MR658_03170 [Campylobacter sp.]|nr:hypothetical protein [Campylobacter sp.]MDD7091360.1 hypothetical protein [Campylobacteraceae bacterium]MCI6177815.1 hypothetical protein [Campylobacter sp.]MCI7501044.1 hypothetical protein [Campylobacter sp.]MDY3246414.1 hypothetical protein [Campylobacter sp.]MDY4012665.1 hypothetical protein [Campylobacter sp.]
MLVFFFNGKPLMLKVCAKIKSRILEFRTDFWGKSFLGYTDIMPLF